MIRKGTSLDKTYHIYKIILSSYFLFDHVARIVDTHICAKSMYETNLANAKPLSTSELQKYEEQYNGPFNVTIGKLLHVQQLTGPDVMNYTISRLAVFLKAPTTMAFEVLNHLMECSYQHISEPIFYPSQPLIPEEIITYNWSLLQQTSYSTFVSFVTYSD